MGATGLLSLLFMLGMGILIVWIQLRLSSKESGVPGGALIAVILAATLGMTAWVYTLPTNHGYTEKVLTCELTGGRTAEATVRLDENGEVAAASDISIKDEDGEKLDDLGWGEDRLRDVQKKLKGDYGISEETPIIWDDEMSNGVKIGGATWNRNAFLIMGLFIDVPLLIIYLLKRRQIRQRRRSEEMKKMSIQELGE